jgi:hypothetical protein
MPATGMIFKAIITAIGTDGRRMQFTHTITGRKKQSTRMPHAARSRLQRAYSSPSAVARTLPTTGSPTFVLWCIFSVDRPPFMPPARALDRFVVSGKRRLEIWLCPRSNLGVWFRCKHLQHSSVHPRASTRRLQPHGRRVRVCTCKAIRRTVVR